MVARASVRKIESRNNCYFLFVAITILSLSQSGQVSAQEVRSGWILEESGTNNDLLAAEVFESEIWAFGASGSILRSIDGGISWTESPSGTEHDLITSDSGFGTIVVAAEEGTILKKAGDSWIEIPNNLSHVSDISLTGENSLIATSGSEIWLYSGSSWQRVWNNSLGHIHSVSFLDSENGVASGENGTLIATLDGGVTWDYRDAPPVVSSSTIIEIEYFSSIRVFAISEEGHILKSSREGSIQAGVVWNLVEIERVYPPGQGSIDENSFQAGGEFLTNKVTTIEILSQSKILFAGPNGFLALSLDGGNIVSSQMIPISNSTNFNAIAMEDGFRGVVVGDEGVVLRTENAGSEEIVGFEVADFSDFGQFVDYSKERLLDGLVATAKIVIFGIILGFSLGIILSMLKTSPTTLKNVVQTNRWQVMILALRPLWLLLQTPISIINTFPVESRLQNPLSGVITKLKQKSVKSATDEPLNIFAIRSFGLVLIIFGIWCILDHLDEISALNLDGWEHIYAPIGDPMAFSTILVGFGLATLGGILSCCNGDFSIREIQFGSAKITINPWGIKPLNTIATTYTDIFRNTPLLVQFMFIHFGFELGRRIQDPGLMLFSFDFVSENPSLGFITDIFVVYETDPTSLAYGLPVGGLLDDRAYISAIFALGLNSGAYQCETIRGAIAAIPSGQMEAGRSIGLNYMQSMRLVIMPQAVRICIPPLGNEMVNLVLNSSLAMIIGYAEITRQGKLIVATTFQVFWTWGMVLISYFLITWTLALLLRFLEEKTRIPGLGISGGA